MKSIETQVAVIASEIEGIRSDLSDIKADISTIKQDNKRDLATKSEVQVVAVRVANLEKIAWIIASTIMLAVLGALLKLVIIP